MKALDNRFYVKSLQLEIGLLPANSFNESYALKMNIIVILK